jgi:hypothetical protein
LCRIGPNHREHVLAKLRNPEPTMPQRKVTLASCDNKKKTRKRQHFQQGHSMTLAAADIHHREKLRLIQIGLKTWVISKILKILENSRELQYLRPHFP